MMFHFPGYRRITVLADSRNILMKKYLSVCGFSLESVMRKHRIVRNRNRDTAVYVLLNSEWPEEEYKLKKRLNIK